MSHIVCPLCGKNAPLSTFNPLGLEEDLMVVSFQGLGRGRGFRVSDASSILGDNDLSRLVAERVMMLCRMFLDEGIIGASNLQKMLNIQLRTEVDADNAIRTQKLMRDVECLKISEGKARDQIKSYKGMLKQERNRVESLELKIDEFEAMMMNVYEEMDDMIEVIENAVGEEIVEDDVSKVELLWEAVNLIIEELEAVKADREE